MQEEGGRGFHSRRVRDPSDDLRSACAINQYEDMSEGSLTYMCEMLALDSEGRYELA
jgi:hypothetical protein